MAEESATLGVTEQDAALTDDLAEILEGLSRPQKALSPKFFYDEEGSQLFERITEQPEYYPTQTELAIMREHADEMADLVGPQASLIEFGSGSSLKTRLLLKHLHDPAVYVPVDISRELLVASAESLDQEFPGLEVLPVVADFTHPFELPDPKIPPARNVVYFPGSTIGNFPPDGALELLKVMHGEAGADGALLIGVDLQKDKAVLEAAYNDTAGITAAFNLNLLVRLNREFGADFEIDAFEHVAFYNESAGRIEMHLRARSAQQVRIAKHVFRFRQGETIHTENSHKFTLAGFRDLAGRAGFAVEQVWTDENDWFSIQYCVRD